MFGIVLLLSPLCSRQRPVVETEPAIREAFQKFLLGAGPLQILAEGGGELASHIGVEDDRFREGLSERRLMEGRNLPANLRDRGIAGTQMIEDIVNPHLRAIVEHACDAPEEIFRRTENERIQRTRIGAGDNPDLRHDVWIAAAVGIQENVKSVRKALIHIGLAHVGAGHAKHFLHGVPVVCEDS